MRKLICYAAMFILPLLANAQTTGRFTITPRVGVMVSDLAGSDYKSLYESKAGLGIGADVEYRINDVLGLSLGAFYTQQGAKTNMALLYGSKSVTPNQGEFIPYKMTDEITQMGTVDDIDFNRKDYNQYLYYRFQKTKLDFLSVPVLLQAHVWDGLTVKLGVQCDILLNAKIETELEAGVDGVITHSKPEIDVDDTKNVAFSIPVGVSYSYKNIELDARYLWGVSKINKQQDDEGNYKNSSFMITLGYNFHL